MKQIKFTEDIYINCTHCVHFSSFADWLEKPPGYEDIGSCEYEFDDISVTCETVCNYFKNNNTI